MLAHDCPGKAATDASVPRSHRTWVSKAKAQKECQKRLRALEGYKSPDYGDQADLSRMDWMIAQDMAKSSRFTMQDIENGIRECSPHVDNRKVGHTEDYARRTAEKAWSTPKVQAHRQA